MLTIEILSGASDKFPDADALVRCLDEGQVCAQCRLWWTNTPTLEGKKTGMLGDYLAMGNAGARLLLQGALQELAGRDVQIAVGPMDGSTWRSYRWVTEKGSEPPFFLEPQHPAEYPGQFLEAGFRPLAEYFSALADDLSVIDDRLERVARRLENDGVILRNLDANRVEQELRAIFEVSVAGFQENFLYTPLQWEGFRALYQPLLGRLDSRLIWLAERQGKTVGVVFGFPDFLATVPGETMILKTVVTLPERRLAGLGAWLVGRFHQSARDLGAKRVIHALMHESNNSRNLSGIYARTMRRYTLYGKEL